MAFVFFYIIKRVLNHKPLLIIGEDGITVYDIYKLMNGISPMKRNAIKANLKLKYPPISISLNTADIKFSEVLYIIQTRLDNR